MRHVVIRVDWEAWAQASAASRRACGALAFASYVPPVEMPPPPADPFERAARRPRVFAAVEPDPFPEPAPEHLPGVDAWIAKNQGKRGVTC